MQLHQLAGVFTVFVAIGCNFLHSFAQTTVRPYKFGFTIDEQQHRSEKRDERGIVMGEFGFITADGIYHVTVYATDEEGKFHILAMRNYPYESPPKTINMIVEPKKNPLTPIPTTTAIPKLAPTKHSFSNPACGGCFLTNNNEKPKVEDLANVEPKVAPTKNILKKPLKIDIRTLARQLPLEPETNSLPSITGIGSVREIVNDALPKILNEMKQAETIIQTPLIKKTIANNIENVKSKQISTNTQISNSKTTSTILLAPTTTPTHTPTNTPKRISKGSSLNAIKPQKSNTTPSTPTFEHKTNIEHKLNNSVKEKNNADHVASNTSPDSSISNRAKPNTQTVSNGLPQTASTLFGKTPSTTTNTNTNTNGENSAVDLLPTSGAPSTATAAKPSASATPKQQGSAINNNNNNRGSDSNVGGITGSGGNDVIAGAIADGVKSIIGEPGDLYRFKYVLDYNGHTETGSRNGNKEGSYFSIGEDNVERTVEYVANEYGYHPRIRWRKLDTPVKTKENTLKDYEFVWFKK